MSQASQFNSMKLRLETCTKEIETLRLKQREDQMKHKEEISVLRKETMRIRTLESEIKSITRSKEKNEEQFSSHLTIAKTKLEKEHANVTKLTEMLKASESRLKEAAARGSKIDELEASLMEYQKKARSYKTELHSTKERISSLESTETEYKSYRREVSVKLEAY